MTMPTLPARSIPLDLPSEGIFAWEHENYSQTDYAAFLVKGKCHIDALAQAVVVAQQKRPTFHANLVRVQSGLWGQYAWQVREQLNELVVHDFTHFEALPENLGDWIHEQMGPEVAQLQNLRVEFPVKFILFCLPQDHHFIVMKLHHVATDGGGVYNFLREIFRLYHYAVKNDEPDWGGVAGMHAMAGKVVPVSPPKKWEMVKFAFAESRKFPRSKLAQFQSSPEAKSGRTMVRHTIDDPLLQKALRDRVRKDGGTLTDLVVASSKLAIEQWNTERDAPADIMYHGIAVNQRLRQDASQTQGQGNPMSAVMIPSSKSERKDPESLLRYVIEQRKIKMSLGHDIALAKLSHVFLRASRIFPMSLRYRILRLIFDMPISHFITNLGVIWPRIVDGKITGETAIRTFGDLELLEMYSSVGSTKNNPQGMIMRTFLGKLYLDAIYGKWGVREQDAKDFSRLIYEKLVGYL